MNITLINDRDNIPDFTLPAYAGIVAKQSVEIKRRFFYEDSTMTGELLLYVNGTKVDIQDTPERDAWLEWGSITSLMEFCQHCEEPMHADFGRLVIKIVKRYLKSIPTPTVKSVQADIVRLNTQLAAMRVNNA